MRGEAPKRIRERHGTHEFGKLGADRRSTRSPAARLPGPESAEALPVPANHGLGPNDMERLAPPSPLVGEPQPEETVEAPELRSLRTAAKQDELLPQRQVLEREVSAGSERRTQRAQQRWDEEAALSDRADSLPVLTHSTVQGENGHVGMYHCGDWMRSGRQAEHSVHSSGRRQSRTTETHQDGSRSVSDLLPCSPTGPCGDRSGRAFAVGERASGRVSAIE
jgi:hypothetical protein